MCGIGIFSRFTIDYFFLHDVRLWTLELYIMCIGIVTNELELRTLEVVGTLTDVLPSLKLGPRWAFVSKTVELWGLEGTLPALSTKKGRGACKSFGMGLGRGTSFSYSLELASSQPISWLVRILEHPWC